MTHELPLEVTAPGPGEDLAAWAAGRKADLERLLLVHGGLLFRGGGARTVPTVPEFAAFADVFIAKHMDYAFAITPRSKVSATVATASEQPPHVAIALHGEMDAQPAWPRTILFHCEVAPAIGEPGASGETPIADARRIHDRLAPETRLAFEELGLRYVRHVRGAEAMRFVFGTSVRSEIEAYCAAHGYAATFDGDDRVRTERRAHAIVRHPVTGERLWFNHAQVYHLESFPRDHVAELYGVAPDEPLPLEVTYGDGSRIDRAVMREIRRAYQDESVLFHWRAGDVLLLDNMLVAHGRRPFRGPRRILTAMGNPHPATP